MILSAFPTFVLQAKLAKAVSGKLNRLLIEEACQIEKIDSEGQAWSAKNYPKGYSSYASLCQLHITSPNVSELRRT